MDKQDLLAVILNQYSIFDSFDFQYSSISEDRINRIIKECYISKDLHSLKVIEKETIAAIRKVENSPLNKFEQVIVPINFEGSCMGLPPECAIHITSIENDSITYKGVFSDQLITETKQSFAQKFKTVEGGINPCKETLRQLYEIRNLLTEYIGELENANSNEQKNILKMANPNHVQPIFDYLQGQNFCSNDKDCISSIKTLYINKDIHTLKFVLAEIDELLEKHNWNLNQLNELLPEVEQIHKDLEKEHKPPLIIQTRDNPNPDNPEPYSYIKNESLRNRLTQIGTLPEIWINGNHVANYFEIRTMAEKYLNDLSTSTPETIQPEPTLIAQPQIVIRWNENKNVLTGIFRQLKTLTTKEGKFIIENSIPEVAIFLKNNFSCFEDVKHSTIETMLKDQDGAKLKNRRIIIEREKPE